MWLNEARMDTQSSALIQAPALPNIALRMFTQQRAKFWCSICHTVYPVAVVEAVQGSVYLVQLECLHERQDAVNVRKKAVKPPVG
jgi:hypothetical protein